MSDASSPRPNTVLQLMGPATGGIRQHVMTLVAQCAEQGWLSRVASPVGVISEAEAQHLGVKLVEVGVPAALNPRRLLAASTELRRDLLAHPEVQIVHCHGLKAAWVAWISRPSLPVMLTIHNLVLSSAGGASTRLLRRLEQFIIARMDQVIAGSPQALDRCRGLVPPDKLRFILPVWPEPAPDRSRHQVRAELDLGPGRPLVVCVARHHPQKRLDLLVAAWTDAFAARATADPESVPLLAIVGEGPETGPISQCIAASSVGWSIRLLGRREPATTYVAAADCFILASDWEGVPFVVAEAISLEVPVISTEVGMVPTFLEGSSLIVPVGDVAALSEAILRWESDMERFQAEARGYRQRLQREFGRDVLTAEVVECYQQLARRGQP